MPQTYDVCIRGAGVVGRTLALLLARERLRVALVDPAIQAPASASDVRAYALNARSRALLQSLRSWPDPVHATPVQRMQVRGDMDGLLEFDALDQADDALAWIVDVPVLQHQLDQALHFQPGVDRVSTAVNAPLTVICEGRSSTTRSELGVEFDRADYPQRAIATRLECELPHAQVARQWFTPDGILALLPMGGSEGHQVAVVWSVSSAQVPHLLELDDEAFALRLEMISQGELGQLRATARRAAWPLQWARAERWCGRFPDGQGSWVLAGDAAHAVHPLAGQGLNLGLGDAQVLAHFLTTRDSWRSLGDEKILRRYARQRKAEILPMGWTSDALQLLFARPEMALQQLRNFGMRSLNASGPLKQWMARQAMGGLENPAGQSPAAGTFLTRPSSF